MPGVDVLLMDSQLKMTASYVVSMMMIILLMLILMLVSVAIV